MLVAYRMDWRTDSWLEDALRLVTQRAADALGVELYGLGVPGASADLVLVHAETLAEAVVARPPRALVMARGQVITDARHQADHPPAAPRPSTSAPGRASAR